MRVGGSSNGCRALPGCEATAGQEKSAKKSGSRSSSGKNFPKENRPEVKSGAIGTELDLVDGPAVVVDDDLGWSGERFVLVRFADGHQRYLRADELTVCLASGSAVV